MKALNPLSFLVFGLIISTFFSCKKDSDPISNETDTRILVKEAFARVDRNIVAIAFNSERAEMLKQKIDKETEPINKINYTIEYAYETLKTGKTGEAIEIYNQVLAYIFQNKIPLDSLTYRNLSTMLAISYMRHGEIENCVANHNHQSCFIPIAGEGVHKLQYGSRNAITVYKSILRDIPNDLEAKYLLNLAYMTLGQYPDSVPREHLIDPSWYKSDIDIKPFREIAPELGVNRNGLAGGVVFDDLTNDGWIDIAITSMGPNDPMKLYINNGDGSFTERSKEFGLEGHVSGLNLNQTDYNNDGWIDLYIMRGGWYGTQGDIPNTLLMNTGKGSFEDVTIKAGLTHHAATQTAAWSDLNLDGWLDLVVANESVKDYDRGIDVYINNQDGTFSHESQAYGLTENQFFKGCVATDVNNDRYPDLFFSTLFTGTLLYINQGASGKKQFLKAGQESGIGAPARSFPCWNFDFDNDGNEDLFVSAFSNEGTPSLQWMLSHMGKADKDNFPKLYHNKGNAIFEEMGLQMGLDEVVNTMGCNFGDINVDGFLDFYLATGNPLFQSIVPNKMYLNMDGKKFADVSYSGGFANIQKGHAVSFGDWDHDGDEDIYNVIGGAYEGDAFYNCLFENPNEHNNNWLVLKLTGTTCNRPAIGARVTITVMENGKKREIHRTVTSGASFGANSLALEVGLARASSVQNVTVKWPCINCPDAIFTEIEINKAYSLTQGQQMPTQLRYERVSKKTQDTHSHHNHH